MMTSACDCATCRSTDADWEHTIGPWVARMRQLGILHMVRGDLTLTLGPPPAPTTAPQVDEATEERIAHEKPGPDGLTPSEQADLYGTPFEKG